MPKSFATLASKEICMSLELLSNHLPSVIGLSFGGISDQDILLSLSKTQYESLVDLM